MNIIFFSRREGRARHFNLAHPFAVAAFAAVLVAILAFLYSFWAIAGSGQEAVYWGFLLLMAGVPVYVWVKRGQAASRLEGQSS